MNSSTTRSEHHTPDVEPLSVAYEELARKSRILLNSRTLTRRLASNRLVDPNSGEQIAQWVIATVGSKRRSMLVTRRSFPATLMADEQVQKSSYKAERFRNHLSVTIGALVLIGTFSLKYPARFSCFPDPWAHLLHLPHRQRP